MSNSKVLKDQHTMNYAANVAKTHHLGSPRNLEEAERLIYFSKGYRRGAQSMFSTLLGIAVVVGLFTLMISCGAY
jgi:hypothetical protein